MDWEEAGPMDRAAWAARAMVAQQILSMKLTGFRSAPYDAAENAEDTLNCRRRHTMPLLSNEKI